MENWLQRICGKLTNHKYRKCWAYTEETDPPEYYCRCKLCQYRFWTDKKPKKLPSGGQKEGAYN